MNDIKPVLVVGAGYLGRRVAQLARKAGAEVYATTRRGERLEALAELGLRPVQFDWTDPASFANLPLRSLGEEAAVLVAVSYDRSSRWDRDASQVGGLRRLLDVLPATSRLCYISTTGVYHQTDGSWVDETSPTHPRREGGQTHLRAEAVLHARWPTSPWMVLRLAGIYGPARVPRVRDVRQGRPIHSSPAGYLNLIHVHDAARATLAAWQQLERREAWWTPGMQSRLYLVGDDQPVVRGEFYREVARQCGVPGPRFAEPDGSPLSVRSESNKRVCNRKLRRDLLPQLVYPNYRLGLADVLRENLQSAPNSLP